MLMQDCCWLVDRTSTIHERAIHVCSARCECAAVCDPPNDGSPTSLTWCVHHCALHGQFRVNGAGCGRRGTGGAAGPQQQDRLFRVGCLSPSICASLLELPSRSARRSAVLRPGGILLKKHVQHAQLQAAVHMPQPGVHASDRLAAHTAASPDLLLALALSDPPTVAFAKRCSSAGSGSVAGVLETEAYYFLSLATGRSPKSAAGVTGRDKADCILRTYSTEDAPHEERAGSGGPSKGLYRLTIIYPGAAVL